MKSIIMFSIFILILTLKLNILAQENKVQMTEKQIEQKFPKARFNDAKKIGLQMSNKWEINYEKAIKIAKRNNIPVRVYRNGNLYLELIGYENGRPIYNQIFNLNAAKTISTNATWIDPYFLDGDGVILGLWDDGHIKDSHQELVNRVFYGDTSNYIGVHATFMAGTMIASGVDFNAHGMANQSYLKAYTWKNDLAELFSADAQIQVSNHSYGRGPFGWSYDEGEDIWYWWGDTTVSLNEEWRFGFYTVTSDSIDNLIYAYRPYHLMVCAVGNERDDIGPGPGQRYKVWAGSDTSWNWSSTTREPDGGYYEKYDCIGGGFATAKNVLTVGSVEDIHAGYTHPNDVVMSTFSSWGPTDDGRIKPDIVANGTTVYSCGDWSTTAYDTGSGTSPAAASVSGSLAPILQQFDDLYPTKPAPLASTLKGLIIHTADEAGAFDGPDYRFGWGLMNTKEAIDLLLLNYQDGDESHIAEKIYQGDIMDILIDYPGTEPLIVTICWSDPPKSPPDTSLNNSTPILVHDLDMKIIDPSQTVTLPYVLDPNNPSNPATNGDNDMDNVEKIFLPTSPGGQYIARITHDGNSFAQDFSIFVSGGKFDTTATPPPPPPGDYRVTFDQKDLNSNSIDSVTFYDQFGYFRARERAPIYLFHNIGDEFHYNVRATDKVLWNQKFNNWNLNNYVIQNRWSGSGETELISYLGNTVDALLKIEFSGGVTYPDTIELKDPWYYDNNDTIYQQPYGPPVNLGLSAPFKKLYPTPKQLLVSDNDRKGVFINQGWPSWNPPYYSLSASAEKYIPFHGQEIIWYFFGWTGNNVQFRHANSPQTGVVFQAQNATAIANYKGHLVSNSNLATGSNNGHNLVKGYDKYWLIYEDTGNIYYTTSQDLSGWEKENLVSYGNTNHYPAIAVGRTLDNWDMIRFVFNKTENDTTRIIIGDPYGLHLPIYYHSPAHESNPVIENRSWPNWNPPYPYTDEFLVVFEGYDGLYYFPWIYEEELEEIETYKIPGTNEHSRFPTLQQVGYKQGIAYEEDSQIYLMPYSSSGGWNFGPPYSISEEISNFNKHPSLAIESDGENDGLFWVAWDGQYTMPPSWSIIVYSEKTESYYTFSNFERWYYYPSIRADLACPDPQITLTFEEKAFHDVYYTTFNPATGSWDLLTKISNDGEKPSVMTNYLDSHSELVWISESEVPHIIQNSEIESEGKIVEEETLSYDYSREIRFDLDQHPLLKKKGLEYSGDLSLKLYSYTPERNDIPFVKVSTKTSVNQFFNSTPFTSHRDSLIIRLIVEGTNIKIPKVTNPVEEKLFSLNLIDCNKGTLLSNLFQLTTKDLMTWGQDSILVEFKISHDLKSLKGVDLVIEESILKRTAEFQPIFIENYEIHAVDTMVIADDQKIDKDENSISVLLPDNYSLYQNHPNPFNPYTTIAFDLPRDVNVSLEIFDITGRKIRTLVNEPRSAGTHQVVWNGQDDHGNSVASGLYVYRIQAGDFVQSKKMLFMK